MKQFLVVVGCLLSGLAACVLSMLGLTTPAHRGGGSWDLSPLASFIYGAPTWILSFLLICWIAESTLKDRGAALLLAATGAFILTILKPQILRAAGAIG